MRRRCTFTADRIGSALGGIGIRGIARTRSFPATEFSIVRLAGDSTRRFMRDGRRLDLATDSGMADITGAITTTLGLTIMLGDLGCITILACVAADLPRVVALLVFAVVEASTAGALEVDSMAAVADSMMVADLVAVGMDGKLASQGDV